MTEELQNLVLDVLLLQAPGYAGSRISYRNSRISVNTDTNGDSMVKESLRDVSAESDHERLIYLLIGRALFGHPSMLLEHLAGRALRPCPGCCLKHTQTVSESEDNLLAVPGTQMKMKRRRQRKVQSTFVPDTVVVSGFCENNQKALLGALDHWVAAFPRDFAQKDFLDKFNDICNVVGQLNIEEEAESRRVGWAASNALTSPVVNRRNNFHNKSMSLMRNRGGSTSNSTRHIQLKSLSGNSPDPFAEHLTFLEQNQMDKITSSEICEEVMGKERGRVALNNVSQYLCWSSRLSELVASQIVSCQKLPDRVEMIEFFMDAALSCCRLGNLNSCMALTAGLSSPCIRRLSKTWDRIERTKLKVLEHICDPQGNFSNYRVILKMFEAERNTPVLIPIFSIFLKDCYFRLKPCMEPGDLAADQQLKCWTELTGPIADFDHWRSRRIQLTKRERLITYLSSYQALDEKALFDHSFSIQTPSGAFEKSQRRLFRAKNYERSNG